MAAPSAHQPIYRRPLFDEPKRVPGLVYAFLFLPPEENVQGRLSEAAASALAGLSKQTCAPLQPVVLFSGTDDGSLHEQTRGLCPAARFLSLRDNLTTAQAFNLGFLYAVEEGADFVLCLKPGAVLQTENALSALTALMREESKIGMTAPVLRDGTGFAAAGLRLSSLMDLDFLCDAGVQKPDGFLLDVCLIRRDLLDAGLRFREDFVDGLEGLAFALEARRRGWASAACPSAEAMTQGRLMSRLQPSSAAGLYRLARNHMRAMMDHAGPVNFFKQYLLRCGHLARGRKAGIPASEAREAVSEALADARQNRMGYSPKWDRP